MRTNAQATPKRVQKGSWLVVGSDSCRRDMGQTSCVWWSEHEALGTWIASLMASLSKRPLRVVFSIVYNLPRPRDLLAAQTGHNAAHPRVL